MESTSEPVFTVTLAEEDAENWIRSLDAAGIEYKSTRVLKHEGGGLGVAVVLPCVLATVQVVATLLAARLAARSSKEMPDNDERSSPGSAHDPKMGPVKIKVARMYVSESEFSVERVEAIIGRPLDE